MKVISFNIRYTDDPNGNSIKERSKRLKKILDKYDADIVGFQEAVPEWMEYLKENFGKKYNIYNKYRASYSLESTPIMWKKESFECIQKEYFWLSDTPKVESCGYDSYGLPRIGLFIHLKRKSDGAEFGYINTHFGFGDKGQVKSCVLIDRMIKEKGIKKAIITADFNMEMDSAAYKKITEKYLDVNMATIRDLGTTFHDYNPAAHDDHIDYCFITPNTIKPIDFKIITDTVNGKFPSDHFGILSELEF